jgi:hypothetical protein
MLRFSEGFAKPRCYTEFISGSTAKASLGALKERLLTDAEEILNQVQDRVQHDMRGFAKAAIKQNTFCVKSHVVLRHVADQKPR